MFALITLEVRYGFGVEEFVEESAPPSPLASIANANDVPRIHVHT